MKLLFVCTANISRSFFAEKLFAYQIESNQLNGVAARSAGIHGIPGRSADPVMMAQLEEMGIGPVAHESTQITPEHVEWADLILVMELHHFESIIAQWPEAADKVELLGKYISEGTEEEIMDPYGRSTFQYRVAHSQLTMAIEGLIRRRIMSV